MKKNSMMYLPDWGEIEEIGNYENGKVHVYIVGGLETWCRFSEIEFIDID